MKGTHERFNFALRPNKHIERRIIFSALDELRGTVKWGEYQYIGFGSLWFADFRLAHDLLGINDLTSLEHRERVKPRLEFNRPYAAVSIDARKSSDALREYLTKGKPGIYWLDYEERPGRTTADDLNLLAEGARSGDFVIITNRAQPESPSDQIQALLGAESDLDAAGAEGADSEEMEELREDVQRARKELERELRRVRDRLHPWFGVAVPKFGEEDLTRAEIPRFYYKILLTYLEEILHRRNSSLPDEEDLRFLPLLFFSYADGEQMMTIAGVFANDALEQAVRRSGIYNNAFVRGDADYFSILAPVLTHAEIDALSKLLPQPPRKKLRARKKEPGVAGIATEDLDAFQELYLYYPRFGHQHPA